MTTVTQADREAAADIVGPKSSEGRYPGFACDYREGRCDTSSLVQAFARYREAAFEAGAKAMQEGDSYAAWQQKRGMLADKVDWAILEYDEYMKDDAYDAQRVLDRIIKGLRTLRDSLAITALDPAQIVGGGE